MHVASKIVHKFRSQCHRTAKTAGWDRREEKRTSVETNCRRTAEVVMWSGC